MSDERKRVCCNCEKCKRETVKDNIFECFCEQRNHKYMSYLEVMTGWCCHWSKDHKFDEVKK